MPYCAAAPDSTKCLKALDSDLNADCWLDGRRNILVGIALPCRVFLTDEGKTGNVGS